MKKILVILFLVIAAQSVSGQPIKKLKIGELQKMIDTSTVPLVVNFWATWCAPCIHEIPWFEKNVAGFADKKIRLVLVSIDFPGEYPKGITDFVKKNHYTSRVIWLNETDSDMFCPKIDKSWDGSIPVTLMVNNKKHYRQFYKQQLPEAKLVQELQRLTE